MLLMSEEKAKALGLKPLARILGFADAEQAPIDFATRYADSVYTAHALIAHALTAHISKRVWRAVPRWPSPRR
jgi:acetyl-CoA acetyltransferase